MRRPRRAVPVPARPRRGQAAQPVVVLPVGGAARPARSSPAWRTTSTGPVGSATSPSWPGSIWAGGTGRLSLALRRRRAGGRPDRRHRARRRSASAATTTRAGSPASSATPTPAPTSSPSSGILAIFFCDDRAEGAASPSPSPSSPAWCSCYSRTGLLAGAFALVWMVLGRRLGPGGRRRARGRPGLGRQQHPAEPDHRRALLRPLRQRQAARAHHRPGAGASWPTCRGTATGRARPRSTSATSSSSSTTATSPPARRAAGSHCSSCSRSWPTPSSGCRSQSRQGTSRPRRARPPSSAPLSWPSPSARSCSTRRWRSWSRFALGHALRAADRGPARWLSGSTSPPTTPTSGAASRCCCATPRRCSQLGHAVTVVAPDSPTEVLDAAATDRRRRRGDPRRRPPGLPARAPRLGPGRAAGSAVVPRAGPGVRDGRPTAAGSSTSTRTRAAGRSRWRRRDRPSGRARHAGALRTTLAARLPGSRPTPTGPRTCRGWPSTAPTARPTSATSAGSRPTRASTSSLARWRRCLDDTAPRPRRRHALRRRGLRGRRRRGRGRPRRTRVAPRATSHPRTSSAGSGSWSSRASGPSPSGSSSPRRWPPASPSSSPTPAPCRRSPAPTTRGSRARATPPTWRA